MKEGKKDLTDKHPGKSPDPKIQAQLEANNITRELPCAVAFQIVDELKVTPAEVGITSDLLNIKITKCQIGLFGYQPNNKPVSNAKEPPIDLKEAVVAVQKDNRLTCEAVWEIASRLKVGKIAVGGACEALGVKVKQCQIGAF